MRQILPTNNLLFKKVLASDANKDILAGLINDFFNVKAEEIVIEAPYSIDLYAEILEDKPGVNKSVLRETIKDVAASFKVADFVSEVQVQHTKFFDERALYYSFSRFCSNYAKPGEMVLDSKGNPILYSSLRPLFALNILGYSHFKGDSDALRIFQLYDPERDRGYNKELLRLGFFELSKTHIETANHKHWYDYFKTGKANSEAPDYIKKASQIIEWNNLEKEERDVLAEIEKAQAILDTQVASSYLIGKEEGKAEGELKGRAEGELKGKKELVRSLFANGVPLDVIAKSSGFSLDQIQGWIKS